MQQKHKILASLIANSKQIYTTNGTIPVSKSSSFRNTGKVSGVAIMGQMASNKYGAVLQYYIQLQLGSTVPWQLGLLLRCLNKEIQTGGNRECCNLKS